MSLVDTTVTVRRGGSYLTIPRLAVERYLAKGYDVVDENDNVLQASTPNDVNTLKRAYEAHIAKIKALEERIKQLESEKSDKEVSEPEKPVSEKPARKTTAKKSK